MSEYEPTQADLDAVMAEFDPENSEAEEWVDSILAGLSGKDY